MSHKVSADRPTDEYIQLVRTAVKDALESVRPYFEDLIRLNGELETDANLADSVRHRIGPKVKKVLFRYAVKHRMLDVTVRRPHKSDPDLLTQRHKEPIISDMPSSLTNLDRLIPDYAQQINAFIAECRKPSTGATSGESGTSDS